MACFHSILNFSCASRSHPWLLTSLFKHSLCVLSSAAVAAITTLSPHHFLPRLDLYLSAFQVSPAVRLLVLCPVRTKRIPDLSNVAK